MEFVVDVLFLKQLVERRRAHFKIKFVVASAIEVNGQRAERSFVFPGKRKSVVLFPMSDVDRIPEDRSQQLTPWSTGAQRGIQFLRRVGNEGCALRAHSRKHLGISKREAQRSVTSHGDSGDRSRLALAANPIFAFNVGNEFLQKEIAVEDFTVGGVYVEAGSCFGRNDQEIADFMLLAQVFDQVPSAAFEQSFLVFAEAVQEIEHRESV